MHTSTETSPPRAVNELHLPLDTMQLQDTSATPTSSSDHTSIADDTLPLNVQPTPSNCIIIIQNNCIAEGGTINIFSSNCTSSTVTKLDHVVAATKEPTLLQPPLTMQPEPVELGRESIVLSGNSFGECVMINVGSPNCTGAIKQTVNGVPK
ncbi:hypothetical protein K503DRAFT_772588 [Rhizopogon vinicolor AM-OR11-026]|uniref:Uncharacterized protein n=1 Tax=Rhizopogon vinicolor AM-OR11-026 TaxID=1314800 RepID=A0A1B7MUS8_9AGAM|nr:hypothetical protein K503DRAFT_772588 [Rhizopogon vinicolor AM-OR11-026]